MAYNLKDVFYLSTSAAISPATAGGVGSAQLDLSAYIDPIARGRQKGTGLAIYKVHFHLQDDGEAGPIDDAEAGTMQYGLLAGAGLGDIATTTATTFAETMFQGTNSLLIASEQFFGPKSMVANACTTPNMIVPGMKPSTEVPYVVVRDNVCLTYNIGDAITAASTLSVRLECAQVTLDQATLNQLLRTQTV
jgi:hypothetical protein